MPTILREPCYRILEWLKACIAEPLLVAPNGILNEKASWLNALLSHGEDEVRGYIRELDDAGCIEACCISHRNFPNGTGWFSPIANPQLPQWDSLFRYKYWVALRSTPRGLEVLAAHHSARRSAALQTKEVDKVPALASSPTKKVVKRSRRGRLNKAESEAKRAQMLATLCQHPSLKDDPGKLAAMVGVSSLTVRRWLDDEERKYRESVAANPEPR
jgi:hypothetical protein